jgi:excisionase family DNA binding protein
MTNEERNEALAQATITVEVAARVLGIGRVRAYQAAKEGQIPTIMIGRRLLVPVPRLKAMLGIEAVAA